MKRFFRGIALLLFTILCCSFYLQPANAQDQGWQTPFEVSKPELAPGEVKPAGVYPTSWFPNIAADASGTIHVIWYSGIQHSEKLGDSTDLLMYRNLRNGSWSQVNNIVAAATGGYTVRNGIAFGRDGKLHVALRSLTGIKYTSATAESAWFARSWSEPYPISGKNGAYYTAIAVDSHNNIHIVWSETVFDDPAGPIRECSNCANLYYRNSTNGGKTWSPPINLSNSLDGDNRPQIIVDNQDRIHIAWDQGRDWYAGAGVPKHGVYRISSDGGRTWSDPVYFAPSKTTPDVRDENGNLKANPDAPQQTTLAVQPDGNPIVVYRTVGGKIYYQNSTDGGTTWAAPRLIPGIMARDTLGDYLDKYTMAVDGSGNVHLMMVGYPVALGPNGAPQTPPALMHLTWNGTLWSLTDTVQTSDLYPEYPTAIVSGRALHVVWFTRSAEDRFTSDRSHYRVWYSSRPLNSQPLQALPTFTPAPTLAPTLAPTAVPPATPMPLTTSDKASPALDRPPAWEATAMPLIFIAIVPTLLLIGVVIGVRIWMQRRD